MRIPLLALLIHLFVACGIKEPQEVQLFPTNYTNFSYTGRISSIGLGPGENEGEILIKSLHGVTANFEQNIPVFEKTVRAGCTTHPDLENHHLMVEKLLPFMRKHLK